ncbi:MAG: ergothioneine biosynthesis protein EgtB [Goleter apudmare HA4340-LM2]|nr:ergothioneine biosynthesis protein EgtB [Goleter apudmare HA4340-LM2]
MISKFSNSNAKEFIFQAFHQCRLKTLALLENIDATTFCSQPHPEFSPVGWHFGHIAYTESLWLLEKTAGLPCFFPQYRQLFAADGLPKSARSQLPNPQEIRDYLDTIREKVLYYLEVVDIEPQERLWHFLIQHESQHCETINFVLELLKSQGSRVFTSSNSLTEMVQIPAGEFEQGSNSIAALDNECPAHKVYLNTYWIDRYPVTCSQYLSFIEAGGYTNPLWWSEAGWQWVQKDKVKLPLYMCNDSTKDNHPVCGVSWYEAEAYSRFVGKRLPTEAEWEKAASWDVKANCDRIYPWGVAESTAISDHCNCDRQIATTTPVDAYPGGQSAYGVYDMLGNVWEWTASWFDAYNGFQSYPYMGYSQVYFDHKHRVLKGGSWATYSWSLRSSFRNWYHPGVRQIFAGFRCAADEEVG